MKSVVKMMNSKRYLTKQYPTNIFNQINYTLMARTNEPKKKLPITAKERAEFDEEFQIDDDLDLELSPDDDDDDDFDDDY
jgi:hypothetical protein